MILFFDTETTGLVRNWNDPHDSKNPHLVQIGAILTNESGRILNCFSTIVKPDGFEIPTEAACVHGITTEVALKHGIHAKDALNTFIYLCSKAELVIAHNFKFDSVVIQKALGLELKDRFTGIKSLCTMLECTPICQIPSKWGGFKWPKLSEAYKFFFKEELKDAHDALTDVIGCKRVYFDGYLKHSHKVTQARD